MGRPPLLNLSQLFPHFLDRKVSVVLTPVVFLPKSSRQLSGSAPLALSPYPSRSTNLYPTLHRCLPVQRFQSAPWASPVDRSDNSLLSLRIPFAPLSNVARRSIIKVSPMLMELESDLSTTMASLWAASTWDARMRCWDQLMEFVEALQESSGVVFQEHDLERLAMLFIQYRQTTGSSPATLLSTASNISAAMTRVCPSLTKVGLMDLTRILRRLQVAPLQALPFSVREIARWILSLPRKERLAGVLSWCLSARWDDIIRLTKDSITVVPNGWLIHMAETKTSVLTDFRPDAFLPIRTPPLWMSQALASLRPSQPLTTMSTDKARQTMQLIVPSQETLNTFPTCRDHFTAHSPRRGSQTCLWQRAAEGSVAGFGALQIAMMGRHKTPNWPVPASSVRYAADRFAMATALGLAVTTRYLLGILSSALAQECAQGVY